MRYSEGVKSAAAETKGQWEGGGGVEAGEMEGQGETKKV